MTGWGRVRAAWEGEGRSSVFQHSGPEQETRSPKQYVLADLVPYVLRGLLLTPLHTSSGGNQFNRT